MAFLGLRCLHPNSVMTSLYYLKKSSDRPPPVTVKISVLAEDEKNGLKKASSHRLEVLIRVHLPPMYTGLIALHRDIFGTE
jgi:hypothetical protein